MRLLTASLALLPLPAIAHEGHGAAAASSLMHQLEPVHAIPLVLIVCAGAYLLRRWRRQPARLEARRDRKTP